MKVFNEIGRTMDISEDDFDRLIANGVKLTLAEEKVDRCPYCDKKEYTENHLNNCRKDSPLISVIIPNRRNEKNTTSLKNQTYKNIEIIEVVDRDGSGAAHTRNKGLKKAKGEFIFYCDNDLELEPDCLEVLYRTLRENKEADWSFGRFTINGEMFNRNKGEIPLNTNSKKFIDYFEGISTMSLIRASCNPKMDDNFKRFDDWDLWVTLVKKGHKPAFCDKVLFKTFNRNEGISSKNNVSEWKKKLYEKHLKKIADIIIPHHDQHGHLKNCIERLDNKIFNIIIVSGGSFAENCNQGAKSAKTDNLIFLNDDTLPDIDILCEMVEKEADIVGVAQYIPKHDLVLYGIGYTRIGDKIQADLTRKPEDTHIPSGYCFKVKKKVWDDMKGLDERFINGAEDQDFGFRAIKKGYTMDYVLRPMVHLESQSTGRFDFAGINDILTKKLWSNEKLIKLLNL